jgi:hypothetical protein
MRDTLRQEDVAHRKHRAFVGTCDYCRAEKAFATMPQVKVYDAPLTRFLDQRRTNRGGFTP